MKVCITFVYPALDKEVIDEHKYLHAQKRKAKLIAEYIKRKTTK